MLPAISIVAVTVLAVAGSLDGGFISDDIRSIEENPLLPASQ